MKKTMVFTTLLQGGLLIAFTGCLFMVSQNQVKPVDTYVYSREISRSTQLSEADFKRITIPNDGVTSNMITDKDELIGKHLTTNVFSGEYIDKRHLSVQLDPFDNLENASELRKISIEVDMANAAGGNVKRGDKIDLAYTTKTKGIDQETGQTIEFTYTKTFLQDILIYN
ncbi:MAG: hypothetical protein R3Y64_09315, partial [Peptostreptococcaceae bacterium]